MARALPGSMGHYTLTACCAAALLLGGFASAVQTGRDPPLRTGDVVFQTSGSSQSAAIQIATGSLYSHVGLVEVTPEGTFVIEAIGKVSRTPWKNWRARGHGRVLVKRLPNLGVVQAQRVTAAAREMLGRPYDAQFAWDDARIYCSELVNKAYQRGAGITLGRMQRLDSLHLTRIGGPLMQRFGRRIPMDREMVTPASIASDEKLEVVWSSY